MASQFKLKPYAHQLAVYNKQRKLPYWAFLDEAGTGKSKMIIDTSAYQYGQGMINAVVLIAPKDVDHNWLIKELPEHMPDHIDYRAAILRGAMPKYKEKALDKLTAPGVALRYLLTTYDTLANEKAFKYIKKFLTTYKCMLALDESHHCADPKSSRTKRVMKLRDLAHVRRIASGTPYTYAPFSLFPQFSFLDDDILETTSFYAFKAEYAELVPEDSHIMRHIKKKAQASRAQFKSKRPFFAPQIVARTPTGEPKYRNLEKLGKLIDKYSSRNMKDDCLDLPKKVYQRAYYELAPHQRRVYENMQDTLRLEWAGMLGINSKLNAVMRLQQIACGYAVIDGVWNNLFDDYEDNPRFQAYMRFVEEQHGEKTIVWTHFQEDRDMILDYYGSRAAAYSGSSGKRQANLKAWRDSVQILVANPVSGGEGLTLNEASSMYYYSNQYKLVPRLQSEDRFHRIGQTASRCLIVDCEGIECSVDALVINNLRNKKEVADIVLGDNSGAWI